MVVYLSEEGTLNADLPQWMRGLDDFGCSMNGCVGREALRRLALSGRRIWYNRQNSHGAPSKARQS